MLLKTTILFSPNFAQKKKKMLTSQSILQIVDVESDHKQVKQQCQ